MGSTGENDWDSLVDEMEQIRSRVEKTLDAQGQDSAATEGGDAQDASHQDSQGASQYASMDEMLSGLGREEIEADAGKGFAGSNVVPLQAKPAEGQGQGAAGVPESALSLAVVGALKLRLELTREAQTVQIHLEESQLRVELSDGTQFRIPLNKAA